MDAFQNKPKQNKKQTKKVKTLEILVGRYFSKFQVKIWKTCNKIFMNKICKKHKSCTEQAT